MVEHPPIVKMQSNVNKLSLLNRYCVNPGTASSVYWLRKRDGVVGIYNTKDHGYNWMQAKSFLVR